MIVRKTTLGDESDPSPVFGVEAISLVTQLTRSCWALATAAGSTAEAVPRDRMPVRFVPRVPRA